MPTLFVEELDGKEDTSRSIPDKEGKSSIKFCVLYDLSSVDPLASPGQEGNCSY